MNDERLDELISTVADEEIEEALIELRATRECMRRLAMYATTAIPTAAPDSFQQAVEDARRLVGPMRTW